MFLPARIYCETMWFCQFYHDYKNYTAKLSKRFKMSLCNIQPQITKLKIRILELQNEVNYHSQISSLRSKTIRQIEKTVNNPLTSHSSGVCSLSIVDKTLQENANVGGGKGIRRSLSYDISSQIDQEIVQTFRGLHDAITSIIEQYKKSADSCVRHQAPIPSVAFTSKKVIKEVPRFQVEAYQIPVELIVDFDIQELPCLMPNQTVHVDSLSRQSQQRSIQKATQVIVSKEISEHQILRKKVQDLEKQNKLLLQQLEQIKQNGQLEFFIQICTPELNIPANQYGQDTDIPITFLIQNEAGDVLDLQIFENEKGQAAIQQGPNLTTSVTQKIELPTAPDIFSSYALEDSRVVRDPLQQSLQQSVISIDFEDANFSQSPDKTTKHLISIQETISILDQKQAHEQKVTTIPVRTRSNGDMKKKEKDQNFNQKIVEKIVYNIAEIPVEIIIIEDDQRLSKYQQGNVPILKQANLDDDILQAQANCSIIKRKIYSSPQKDVQQEDLKTGNQPQSKLKEQPQINSIDYKYAIAQIPVEIYIQRIVQVPVQLQIELDYNYNRDGNTDYPHQKANIQIISQEIVQIPVETAFIQGDFDENKPDNKLIIKKQDQDKRREQTKFRIVQAPVEQDMQSSEAQKKLALLQQIHLQSSKASQQLIRSLYCQIGKLQKIVVQLNQLKQQALYEMENKSLNEQILKKKLGDKELALMGKEEEIQHIINQHQQNMNLFASYKEEYAQFVHNVSKGGLYSFQIPENPPISHQNANNIEATKRVSLFVGDGSYGQLLGSERYDARLPEELPAVSRATEVPSKEKTASISVSVQTQFPDPPNEKDVPKDKTQHFSILPIQTPTVQDLYDPIKLLRSQQTHSLEEDLLPSLQGSPQHSPQYHLRLDSIKNVDEQFLMSEEQYEHAYLHKLYQDASVEAERYRGLYYQTDQVLLQLRSQINDCNLEIKRLQNHTRLQAEQIEEKNKRIDELGELTAQQEAKIDALKRKLDKLEEECMRGQAEYQALEASFEDRVGKLRAEIQENSHEIQEQKQECERHKELYQAQIQRLRDEIVSRQEQIESLQEQITAKQSKIERLKHQHSDLKSLVQRNQHEEVDAAVIYEREFLKVKKQFERRQQMVMQQVQEISRQNQSLKQQLENQNRQKQKLIEFNQDLTLKLTEKERQLQTINKQNDQPKSQGLCQNKLQSKLLLMDSINLQVGKQQKDRSNIEPFQIRVENLSRLQKDEQLELSLRYIQALEKLLLQYQANMKTTLQQMEDFFDMLCQFFRQKLLKEQQKGISQIKFPLPSNKTNALLTKKIALSIENDRLAKIAFIAEKKLQFLWGELISQTPRKTAVINHD